MKIYAIKKYTGYPNKLNYVVLSNRYEDEYEARMAAFSLNMSRNEHYEHFEIDEAQKSSLIF